MSSCELILLKCYLELHEQPAPQPFPLHPQFVLLPQEPAIIFNISDLSLFKISAVSRDDFLFIASE